MAVEQDYCDEGAQKGGKGHGADSGADGRGSIAREGDGRSGGGGEVEGDYVDEDIGSLGNTRVSGWYIFSAGAVCSECRRQWWWVREDETYRQKRCSIGGEDGRLGY